MEITSDIQLKGTAWNQVIDSLSSIFRTRTIYSIYILCLSIGILYDQRIPEPSENGEEIRSVPRNVIQNHDNGKMDYYFQAAILSTTTEDMTEDARLELAFGEKNNGDFNKIKFLTQFANFGATKLIDKIGASPIETMENIKNFIISTAEGRNLDIDALPDDILINDGDWQI